LHEYASRAGFFADCYATELDAEVLFADYIAAFYSTGIFKVERLLLRIAAGSASTDQEAIQLGLGETNQFAIWRVAMRAENQLLMETKGRTRSWFMIEDLGHKDAPKTRLLFGSIVAPISTAASGTPKMGWLFSALLGVHTLYSKALLNAARSRLLMPG
jgi:hypothetical protein